MRAIGIILAGGNNNRMRELSNKRAIAAMPIAGSYRSIDFALSSRTSESFWLPLSWADREKAAASAIIEVRRNRLRDIGYSATPVRASLFQPSRENSQSLNKGSMTM